MTDTTALDPEDRKIVTLARSARAVLGAELTAGGARSGSLRRLASRTASTPAEFFDLGIVPDWLPSDPAARRSLAIRAGLAALSPALARTLDGATLRGFAAQAGDALVDVGRHPGVSVVTRFAPVRGTGRGG